MTAWPARLLTQNSELKPDGIWNWSLPAFGVRLSDGRTMNVCPNAGACASFCYARNGTYLFRNVLARHVLNLEYTLDAPEEWAQQMSAEASRRRYVRIHDSGDFYSRSYLLRWIDIAAQTPATVFYAYTKEVALLKEIAGAMEIPANFQYLFSMGGKQDHLIDPEHDRHADVFPDEEALTSAGYASQHGSDLLAITLPGNRIGILANNIRHFNKKMNGRTFSELQAQRPRR